MDLEMDDWGATRVVVGLSVGTDEGVLGSDS